MKEIRVKIISELMKNSRISDRELAKKLGVSQPTVTRVRHRLHDEGYIKEYTIIPDFKKLGYEILALTLVRLKGLSEGPTEEARRLAMESLVQGPFESVMIERGMGLDCHGVFISYHENYKSYSKLLERVKQLEALEVAGIESFLISLRDTVRYKPLTFSTLAEHVLAHGGELKESGTSQVAGLHYLSNYSSGRLKRRRVGLK